MKKLIGLLGSEKLLKALFIVFVVVYVVFDAKGLYKTPIEIANNDNYKGLFQSFLENGYFNSIAQGTSILYNIFLYGIHWFTGDIDVSFFLLNAISELVLLSFGCYFCYRVFGKNNQYFYIVTTWYVLQILSMRSSLRASNDTFLGVLVMLLLYLLVVKLFDRKREASTFALIGLVLGLCLSVRVTAMLLFPLVAVALLYWIKNSEIALATRIKLVSIFISVTAIVTIALHFPSLVTHQQLSYESKEPDMEVNWVQRNYLGLKKIEEGKHKMHRDAIWKHTKFEEVLAYTKTNGANSLPRTLSEVAATNPFLLLKMALYNIGFCLANYFRFWAFLFLIPIIGLFSRRFFDKEKLPIVLFVIYLACISIVCFSFVELRWIYGYEVLIPVAIVSYFKKPVYFASARKQNLIFSVSLVLVTLFHLKSIFF